MGGTIPPMDAGFVLDSTFQLSFPDQCESRSAGGAARKGYTSAWAPGGSHLGEMRFTPARNGLRLADPVFTTGHLGCRRAALDARHAGGPGPGWHLLQRPAGSPLGVGAGAGAPALLDQHVPDVGPRASVPPDRHNGEINTLRGNVNWIRARQGAISSPILGNDLDKLVAADLPRASPTRHRSTTRSNCW